MDVGPRQQPNRLPDPQDLPRLHSILRIVPRLRTDHDSRKLPGARVLAPRRRRAASLLSQARCSKWADCTIAISGRGPDAAEPRDEQNRGKNTTYGIAVALRAASAPAGALRQAPESLPRGGHRPGPRESMVPDYRSAIGMPIPVPITSPEITSSTRRFCCRPCRGVVGSHRLSLSRSPSTVTEPDAIPAPVSGSRARPRRAVRKGADCSHRRRRCRCDLLHPASDRDARRRCRPPSPVSRAREAATEFAGVEEDIRHVHDQAARRVAGLQNGVELLQQLGSQFHLLRFRLRLVLAARSRSVGDWRVGLVLVLQAIGFGCGSSRPRIVLLLQAIGLGGSGG